MDGFFLVTEEEKNNIPHYDPALSGYHDYESQNAEVFIPALSIIYQSLS